MNEKCKYCDYVSKCSRKCEYGSIMCKVYRSFPKEIDKPYERLQQENKQLKEELECTIPIVEHNRIISEKNEEIHQLKDNWNKLKKQEIDRFNESQDVQFLDVLQDMQELEQRNDR